MPRSACWACGVFPMRESRIHSVLIWVLAWFSTMAVARAQTNVRNGGTYIDARGKSVRWSVARNHALVWDGAPWIPGGGVVSLKSWSAKSTVEDVAADIDALARLKQAGIRDVLVQPASGGMGSVPPARVQAIVDALEGGGFKYGVALDDHVPGATMIRQVHPSRLRVSRIGVGQTARFLVPDMVSARFALALLTGEVVDEGDADVLDGAAYVPPRTPVGDAVALLFPERRIPPDNSPLPDVWSGFETYRDRVLSVLAKVRFGEGLRFFADPLPRSIQLDGPTNSWVPVGDKARQAWAIFLESKYRTPAEWTSAWRLQRPDAIASFAEAGEWTPMWFDGRGLKYLMHARSGARVAADSETSAYWTDLAEFKRGAYRSAANEMAMALKRGVADVPVVVRCRASVPWGWNPNGTDRIDGIGIDWTGSGAARPDALITRRLGDSGWSAKPVWFLSSGLSEAAGRSSSGFASLVSLDKSVARLVDGGDRGFFVSDVRGSDPATDLLGVPDQLAWIAEVGRRIGVQGVATIPSPKEKALPFPAESSMAPVLLSNGGWWLPVARKFRAYDFGTLGKAYGMAEGEETVFVMWSDASRTIRIRIPKVLEQAKIAWYPPDRGSRTKDFLSIRLEEEPVRIFGFQGTLPIPVDAFETAFMEAASAVRALRARREVDAARIQLELVSLKTRHQPENTQSSYTMLQTLLETKARIEQVLRPYDYLWIEAEGGSEVRFTHTFDETEPLRGASGGRVLRVREDSLALAPASASYTVNVNAALAYRLFVATGVGDRFQVRVDGRTLSDKPGGRVGREYGSTGCVWFDQGEIRLERGEHVIEIIAVGGMTLDALMLSSGTVRPDGPVRPAVLQSREAKAP